jgi:hypothetical protein
MYKKWHSLYISLRMTEDQLEQEALSWLAAVGYTPLNARAWDHLDP